MKNKKDPAFTRKLISLVMPIAFQQFMLALVSASDALMLGVISQDSLSAVSLAGQITFIHNLLLEAMTIGLSLIAAQYWGKGDIPAVYLNYKKYLTEEEWFAKRLRSVVVRYKNR